MARRSKLYRSLVWASVILLPFALLSLFVVVGKSGSGTSAATAQGSPGQVVATEAVTGWLDGTPPPVPGGQIVSWNGATDLGITKQRSSNAPSRGLEVDHFTIVDSSGALFSVDVQVAVDPRGGAVAISTPSLIPVPAPVGDGWEQGPNWPGLHATQPTSAMQRSVDAWAQAFASGDSDTLRQAVGDPSMSHFYTPLVGVASVSSKITDAATKDSTSVIARVELSVRWLNQPDGTTTPATDDSSDDLPDSTPDDGEVVTPDDATDAMPDVGDDPTTPVISYDVLIERAFTAAPGVTAWGGPGLGPQLVRYQNATSDAGRPVPTVTTTMVPPTTLPPVTTAAPTTKPSTKPSTKPGAKPTKKPK